MSQPKCKVGRKCSIRNLFLPRVYPITLYRQYLLTKIRSFLYIELKDHKCARTTRRPIQGRYLSNRYKFVKCKDFVSRPKYILSGVLQNSHLGLYLFDIFIDDIIACCVPTRCLLFTDGLKLHRIVTSAKDYEELQANLNNVVAWCEHNGISMNANKYVIYFKK